MVPATAATAVKRIPRMAVQFRKGGVCGAFCRMGDPPP